LTKAGQNTDRTDRGHVEAQENPQKPPISLVGPAVAICEKRAIESPARVMMTVNTGRMKVLQMTILSMMRTMRAVFCWIS
jgi:hypothetical protein